MRELFEEHLRRVQSLTAEALATDDPNAALGLILRAMDRLNAAKGMAKIEADGKDAVPASGQAIR